MLPRGSHISTVTEVAFPVSQTRRHTAASEQLSMFSRISFNEWHRRMQTEHELMERFGRKGFGLWNWCYRGCKPCRWFDSLEYDINICKCCLKFKTFKFFGTLVLICIFAYIFMFSLLQDELLPGGTVFFFFLLFIAAYAIGYIIMLFGLPPMLGYVLTGVICGNVPKNWLPPYDEGKAETFTKIAEKIIVIIAIIRAGLLLDLSRIKGRVQFILRISILPSLCEFTFVWIAGHFLLSLPWKWSALLGSIISMVSLATVTSIMEKNRQNGYGEDKHLSTVLIAAAALEIVFGVCCYAVCLGFLFTTDEIRDNAFWRLLSILLLQIVVGLLVGIVCGILIAFFPDKRNAQAASIRIFVIGLGAFAMASILHNYEMDAAGVLSAITMCLVASNMWIDMGWHDSNNPVQFFYSLAYYFCQPVALSLFGLSVNFTKSEGTEIGLSIAVVIIGVIAREFVCFFITWGKVYPTTTKEKLFISIAWFSKGTFQALLAFAVEYMSPDKIPLQGDFTLYMTNARIIKQTVLFGIFITTPWSYLGLSLLTPKLLTKQESAAQRNSDPEQPG